MGRGRGGGETGPGRTLDQKEQERGRRAKLRAGGREEKAWRAGFKSPLPSGDLDLSTGEMVAVRKPRSKVEVTRFRVLIFFPRWGLKGHK